MTTAASGTLLAQATSTFDPNKVTPGLLGFIVVVAVGLATWFLLRSMNGHLRNVDPRFADRDREVGGDAREGDSQDDARDSDAHVGAVRPEPAGEPAAPDERTRS